MKDSNEHLYGKDVQVPSYPSDITMRRIELLKEHLEEILEYSYYTRNSGIVKDILDEIKKLEEL